MIKPWIAVAAIAIAATSVRAAEPITPTTDKTNVISFGAGSGSGSIDYRHLFLNNQWALIVDAGYHESSTHTADDSPDYHASQHSTQFGLGLRRNFSTSEQLRPFVQVLGSRYHVTGAPVSGSTFWTYGASGGAEYFVGRRVSLEGSAGVQFGQSTNGYYVQTGQGLQRLHTKAFDTFSTELGINFYF